MARRGGAPLRGPEKAETRLNREGREKRECANGSTEVLPGTSLFRRKFELHGDSLYGEGKTKRRRREDSISEGESTVR